MKTVNIREVPLSEIIDLPVYPVADILPMLEKNASKRDEGKTKTITLAELADSINEYGLQEPIVLFDTKNGKFLLDGRNRRAACIMAAQVSGDSPNEFMVTVEDFIGTEDEADEFVFTAGLDRRDLEATQRAMSAARFEIECPEAFERMKAKARAAQREAANRTNVQLGRGDALATNGQSVEEAESERAWVNQMLADRFRASVGYVKDARRILKEKIAASEAAERAAQRAEEYEQVEVEATAELQAAVAVGDKEKAREASTTVNNAANHKVEEREKAAELAEQARAKAALVERLHEGKKTLSEARKERNDSGKDDREVAITKAAQQFNDGYNKVIENGVFLLKEGRDNDQENVRLKYSHIVEKFDGVDEVNLQTQHYFTTEREPTDDASRWAGETRLRLAGIDKMIQEKGVIPSMVTKNPEFLGVIDRLRAFLDEVEKSLSDES